MSYKSVLNASNSFLEAQKQFHQFTSEFYFQLVNNLRKEWDIPPGNLLTYKYDTNDHINLIDDCVGLDNGKAILRVGLIVRDFQHLITFEAHVSDTDTLSLNIIIQEEEDANEYAIATPLPIYDFTPTFNFMGDSLISLYKEAKNLYKL